MRKVKRYAPVPSRTLDPRCCCVASSSQRVTSSGRSRQANSRAPPSFGRQQDAATASRNTLIILDPARAKRIGWDCAEPWRGGPFPPPLTPRSSHQASRQNTFPDHDELPPPGIRAEEEVFFRPLFIVGRVLRVCSRRGGVHPTRPHPNGTPSHEGQGARWGVRRHGARSGHARLFQEDKPHPVATEHRILESVQDEPAEPCREE
jgi:hypothetical protein